MHDASSLNTGLGIYMVDVPADSLKPGDQIVFTFFWQEVQKWEGTNFSVVIETAG